MQILTSSLERVIPIGKENAIHQNELARRLGVSCDTAKTMVRVGRNNGLNILSGNQGYWFAKNDYEMQVFTKTMSKQAFTRLKTIKPIENTLKGDGAQISLFDAYTSVPKEATKNGER